MVGGVSIGIQGAMRYLGIVLDSRWNFREHFRRLEPKLIGAAGALGKLLPNLGGPSGSCRRLYTAVVRSMALYGAPIWAEALNARTTPMLRRPQRVMAIRVIRGYRTIAFEAACALAGTPPWDLDANVMAAVYRRTVELRDPGTDPPTESISQWRSNLHEDLLRRWIERLEEPSAGVLTIGALRPVLRDWLNRRHGVVTFHLAQVLTGHGCFGSYLCRVAQRELTPACHFCGHAEDTAAHTLAVCPAWAEPRGRLEDVVGTDLSLAAIFQAMVGSEVAWNAVATFSQQVVSRKEEAERGRESDPLSDPIRRRRFGRRRAAYIRALPP